MAREALKSYFLEALSMFEQLRVMFLGLASLLRDRKTRYGTVEDCVVGSWRVGDG